MKTYSLLNTNPGRLLAARRDPVTGKYEVFYEEFSTEIGGISKLRKVVSGNAEPANIGYIANELLKEQREYGRSKVLLKLVSMICSSSEVKAQILAAVV